MADDFYLFANSLIYKPDCISYCYPKGEDGAYFKPTMIIILNDLLNNNSFDFGLKAGLTKKEIEKRLGKKLGKPAITTPDVDYHCFDFDSGLCLIIIFDKEKVCYEMKIKLDENKHVELKIKIKNKFVTIDETISFDKLISILSKLKIDWEFDRKMIYLQTICIKLKSGLRLYYAFGNKKENDYGLFVIASILETHHFFPQ